MKNKIIATILLIIMIFPLLALNYHVGAYSGQIDPKNYITLPDSISVQDKIGTGTISLSNEAQGYSIAYQKVDVTPSTKSSLQEANK